MSVRSWPTYLLRDIPEATRAALEEDAAFQERAMIEIIREILCGHYGLDCEPVHSPSRPRKPIQGTDTMILRLQPELWEAIKQDAGSAYGSTDKIVRNILIAHYNGGHPQ